MNGREYYTRYLEVKKQFSLTGPLILKQSEQPLHWSNWYRWFHHNGFVDACNRMACRDEYTVPCLDVGMFDPGFDPEAYPVLPQHWGSPDPRDYGDAVATAFNAMTPEAEARVAEIMRKHNAGIPVNDTVARLWARMEPFWQSGSPAYAGIAKGTTPPPKKSDEQRLADLQAKANEPVETTPALLKTLKARQWLEDWKP